jgi:predicted lysophospholipase L1 biosynthesis ABC-type transport system permease subunit
MIMKRTLALLPLVAALSACGTFSSDPYEKRAERERERQEASAARAIDKAPKWMTELPKSDSAIYQNGTAVSPDMGMSVNKAKTMAFGKLCMAAGGRVSQQSKIFRMDSETASTEQSELAIKSSCPGVDISGAEVVETRMIQDGGRIRTYVLVALPTGEANAIQTRRDQQAQRRQAEQRSREAFREMEGAEARPVQ